MNQETRRYEGIGARVIPASRDRYLDDTEGVEWVGEAYAGMLTVGFKGLDVNDAAVACERSSAPPKAWQSGGEGQGSGNFGENHKHHALTSELGTRKQQRSRKHAKSNMLQMN